MTETKHINPIDPAMFDAQSLTPDANPTTFGRKTMSHFIRKTMGHYIRKTMTTTF